MNHFIHNEGGGLSYARQIRPGIPENRSEILADLRMTLDALSETCESHERAKENVIKLLDMLDHNEAEDALREQIMADMGKLEALAKFNAYILARVRGGSFKRMAELFDR